MDIYKNKKKQIRELTEKCKSKQGEYLPSHHGSGSWATTYSTEFIDSASELYLVFQSLDIGDPLYLLAKQFRSAGIRSCRGSEFTIDRAVYLYTSHLSHRLSVLESKSKVKLVKSKVSCPYCEKKVVDLTQHISQSHPDKWDAYYDKNDIKLKGKVRCGSCGCFLKSLSGHMEKCPRTLQNSSR
ncbi:hypothetical protein [Ferrimonas marina]|uniref:Uncharacterized protein n=1 Tax=Ferrimonas marina TaxID=299255 RepID=A0A1M5YTX1_9GAMM|nr:hypothetical protein [Ferrimonas marina]SHI15043.1 hypothetical protein SAMN02745129_4386 [Ferrimonas marina]